VNNKANPGPGDYSPKNTKYRRNPAWKLGNQNYDKRREMEKQDSPGPGNYESVVGATKKKPPGYSFGGPHISKADFDTKTYSPGPGQYNTPSFQSKIAFTMGTRTNSYKTLNSSESFSTAEEGILKKSIAWSFPKYRNNEKK
jgi:hypothetical protein